MSRNEFRGVCVKNHSKLFSMYVFFRENMVRKNRGGFEPHRALFGQKNVVSVQIDSLMAITHIYLSMYIVLAAVCCGIQLFV